MRGLRPPVFSKGRKQVFMLAFVQAFVQAFALALGRAEGTPSNPHGATIREDFHLRAKGGEERLLHVE